MASYGRNDLKAVQNIRGNHEPITTTEQGALKPAQGPPE